MEFNSNMSLFQKNKFYYILLGFVVTIIIFLVYHLYLKADDTTIPNSSEAFIDFEEHISKEILTVPVELSEIDFSAGNLYESEGIASYYSKKFHNRKTANGERFDMNEYSAAHRSLPFGTILKVTNVEKGKSALVRINDRGPFVKKRIIDLSRQSAHDIEAMGLSKVKIEGFVPGQTIIDTNHTFLYGYSIDNPLVCIPDKFVEIIDSANIFHDAVIRYHAQRLTDKSFYIFALANKNNRKEHSESDFMYYIGTIKDKIEITRKEYLANR